MINRDDLENILSKYFEQQQGEKKHIASAMAHDLVRFIEDEEDVSATFNHELRLLQDSEGWDESR